MNECKLASKTFEDFWGAFPRRVGKLAAMKAWNKAVTLDTPENIIAGIAPYKANKPEYADWCHPSTWLHQGRWMDEYENETPLHARPYDDWTDEEKRSTAETLQEFRGYGIEDPLRNMGFGPRNNIEDRLKADGYLEMELRVVG